jgi:hypothetical protein
VPHCVPSNSECSAVLESHRLHDRKPHDVLALGTVLWLGFPVVVLAGSVFHEHVPVPLAALHAGDWLLKLLAITTITTAWR